MGHIDISGVRYELPDGRVLLDDVSFRVGDGQKVALVGANGSGKTTLLRIIVGDIAPHEGAIARSGGLGVMRQFVGQGVVDADSAIADPTVADLLLSVVIPVYNEERTLRALVERVRRSSRRSWIVGGRRHERS